MGKPEQMYDLTGYDPQAVITSNSGHKGLPIEKGTFYQAFSYTIEHIRKTYGTIPIIVFTPVYGDGESNDPPNRFGNMLSEFQNAIIAVCAYHDVYCCDLGRNRTIQETILADKAKYYLDDVHPNGKGSEILSKIIEDEVRKILLKAGKTF